MFDEKENDYLERLNNGYGWCKGSIYEKDDKKVWILRFKDFVCQKNETLDELKSRFDYLLDKLPMFEIKLTDAEKVAKLADALPAEWDDVLKNIKQDSGFLKLHPSDFIKKLKKHSYENYEKKKELMNKMRGNLDKMNLGNLDKVNLDVIAEIDKRICVCLATKRIMKYDNKRGCNINENMNPLDFVKIFCAGTFRTEKEKILKTEEFEKLGSSNSESVCSKCDKSEAENVKLLKDAESLTLEIKNLKNEKKADDKQILEMRSNYEKSKSENVKLLSDLNSMTLENKVLKEKEKDFKNKMKMFEKEKLKSEKEFKSQIKILEDEKEIFGKNNIEKQIEINSHIQKIIQLENEAESARNKIAELENKLKGFVNSASQVCLKPINAVPISDNVTDYDKVIVEDCDENSDDENEKIEKKKLFLKLKEKFQKTVLQSTEKGECSKQKPLKKNAEPKQNVKNVKKCSKRK